MKRDYAVAPGAYLQEWIEEDGHGLTQGELADRLGVSRKAVNELLRGKSSLSGEMAVRLERVTGIPAEAWLRYEELYEADRARIRDEEALREGGMGLSAQVGRYLRDKGATKATRRDPVRLGSDFLAFTHCGSFAAVEARGATIWRTQVATLRESGARVDHCALMAWLAVGEGTDEYAAGFSMSYDERGLQESLPRLRARAEHPDDDMAADLSRMLAESGVVLQFVDPPDNFPLHGITTWLSNGVPVIQLTGRRQTDGFIIWALFHELGHVLNDARSKVEKKTAAQVADEEKAANEFARKTLFGNGGLPELGGSPSDRELVEAARSMGVAPGVLVHELHRRRALPYERGARLCAHLKVSSH